MLNLTYDGSFEGLLTCIFEVYHQKYSPGRILPSYKLQLSFLDETLDIVTNEEKADRVFNSIRQNISVNALQNVYYAYLSEHEEAGIQILKYLNFGWKVGRSVDAHLSDDRVMNMLKLSRRIMGEQHRMLGLIRFHRVEDNLFYSAYEPDFNITSLVAPHFSERLSDQNWIIHDVKRSIAAFYDRKEWYLSDLDMNPHDFLKEKDGTYQSLWKDYFKSISITNRYNPKLQKQHMPMKYWKYLLEKQAD